MSNGRIRSLTGRRLAWSIGAVLSILFWVSATGPVKAQGPSNNEFILRAPAARIQEIATRHGLTIIRQLEGQDVFLVSKTLVLESGGSNGLNGLGAVTEVVADPDVIHFEQNAIVVTPEVASGINLNGSVVAILDALSDPTLVPYFDGQAWSRYVNQPATAAIRLPASHAASGTGAGIVAIIDTGVDPYHSILSGSLVDGYDFVNDVAGNASEWTDLDGSVVAILDGSVVAILDQHVPVTLNGSVVAILDQETATELNPTLLPRAFGHGTMVAGLVHLVAPTARIMPLKAFRADGTSTVFDVVRAIYYAIDHGARVINMSFSAASESPEITRALNVASSMGVISVASAGNLGQEVLVYPGALRNVVGVGSTSSSNPPVRSAFSNFGDALVSLGAPGEAVITTYPGGHWAGVWGTSFSAPLTAGAAALLLQVDPTLNQSKAAERLGNADAMQGGMGKGRLNLLEAVRTVSDTTPPTVSMVTPTSGGALFGNVVVAASASDNVAVTGVRFLLNDNPLGAEVTVAPFEQTWNTATMANGSHVLTAVARDGAGNQSSSIVSVSVANDTAAPTVALTSPVSGETLSGTVAVMAAASDDLEVFGVQFKLDGAPLGGEDTVAPYEVTWATNTTVNGPHTLTAVARDAAGHEATASTVITVVNDGAPPAVMLTSPAGGASLAGVVTATATASDDVGVVGVQFKVDGILVAEDTTAPYAATWNTSAAANGAHTVTAVARDAAGHETTATSVSVTVANDTTAPSVALTSPAAGATVSGLVTVAATASDDFAVVGVQFKVDGVLVGAEDTTAPYSATWNTSPGANGAHTVTAVARDAAGHETTTSAGVTVSNDTTAPTVALSSPLPGAVVSGSVTVAVTVFDEVGVTGVLFLMDGTAFAAAYAPNPFQVTWTTTGVANGPHTLTAVAQDAAGNQAAATGVSVTVANDTTAPTVAVTGPAAGATVGGSVTVTASAADEFGVVGVQFTLDGTPLGAEDTTAPYTATWDTSAATNGAHIVSAVARDEAGHHTTATSVSVTVANDTTAPTVALTSPAAGATVGGSVTVTASAADEFGVVGVQFTLDGMPLGAEDTTAPYTATWDTSAATNGAHIVSAVARDEAGHHTTATSVSVTVANDTTAPTVALTSPAAGATVGGSVTVTASAADEFGVVGVQFTLDGMPLGAEDTTAPYTATWDTSAATNGAHIVSAVARDRAGHETTTSAGVTVSNDTTAPTVALTSPAPGALVSGSVTIVASASDEGGVTGVLFLLDGTAIAAAHAPDPFQMTWTTTSAANGVHTLTAVAQDAAGNQGTATSVSVTVANDTTAPTVALTSPAAGATVGGSVTVTAAASDEIGVAGVQFTLDGVALGAEDTTAPYTTTWDTSAAANGAHVLGAVARDAAGHQTTATSVSVTVMNDTTAPTVALTSPGAGAAVGGIVAVLATASDDVGVVGVQFTVDGVPVGVEDTVAPYELTWITSALANGTHTVSAVARDAAGHQTTTSAEVTTTN